MCESTRVRAGEAWCPGLQIPVGGQKSQRLGGQGSWCLRLSQVESPKLSTREGRRERSCLPQHVQLPGGRDPLGLRCGLPDHWVHGGTKRPGGGGHLPLPPADLGPEALESHTELSPVLDLAPRKHLTGVSPSCGSQAPATTATPFRDSKKVVWRV